MRTSRGGEGDRLTTRRVRTTRAGIGGSSSFTLKRHMLVGGWEEGAGCRLACLSLVPPTRMPDNDTRDTDDARGRRRKEAKKTIGIYLRVGGGGAGGLHKKPAER
jgi:hypothetical protein